MIKLKDLINESRSTDLRYVDKRVKDYNGGLLDWGEAIEYIVKDLGYKPTKSNLEIASDHIGASSRSSDEMIEDRDVYIELYDMLK